MGSVVECGDGGVYGIHSLRFKEGVELLAWWRYYRLSLSGSKDFVLILFRAAVGVFDSGLRRASISLAGYT